MTGLRLRIVVSLLTAFGLAAAASAADVRIGYSEPLEGLSFARSGGDFQKVGAPDEARMRFDAFSQRFDLALTPNRRLLKAVGRDALPEAIGVYRGSLNDVPGSWARIVMVDGQPNGMLFDGKEVFAIDSSRGGEPAIFRLTDLHIEPGALTCAHTANSETAADLFKAVTTEAGAIIQRAQGAQTELDIGLVADFEFASDKGANTQSAMITRMNNVDGIFSSQLGVQITIGHIDIFDSSNDPFDDNTGASNLLGQVGVFRDGDADQRANGLTHLFTGRNLDGSTVGIAYGGALCSGRFGAGLTQSTFDVTTDSLIVAHELGHNFGSPHDGENACIDEADGFLMAPRLNGSDTFSNCSIEQMQDDVARASCISPLATEDLSVSGSGQSAPVLLGNSATASFDVTSAGTETVDDVAVSVALPAGLAFENATTTAGTCTNGASAVDCTIGSLAAGSGATVSVTVNATAVGNNDIVATTSAPGDTNAGNDQTTVRLVVDPAVDLVSTSPSVSVFQVNQQLTLRPQVSNRATIAASNAVVTVSVSAGLRIDGADWTVGSCTVSSDSAECTATSLGASSTVPIDVRMTALSEGQQSYSVSAAADEADRDVSNNDSSASFSVTVAPAAPTGGDDSGGGSLGYLMLALLLAALVLEYRRQSPRPLRLRRRAGRSRSR